MGVMEFEVACFSARLAVIAHGASLVAVMVPCDDMPDESIDLESNAVVPLCSMPLDLAVKVPGLLLAFREFGLRCMPVALKALTGSDDMTGAVRWGNEP